MAQYWVGVLKLDECDYVVVRRDAWGVEPHVTELFRHLGKLPHWDIRSTVVRFLV